VVTSGNCHGTAGPVPESLALSACGPGAQHPTGPSTPTGPWYLALAGPGLSVPRLWCSAPAGLVLSTRGSALSTAGLTLTAAAFAVSLTSPAPDAPPTNTPM